MKYSTYGSKEGRLVIYFNGAPGSSSEGSILDVPALHHGLRVICFDRFSLDSNGDQDAYYEQIALEITKLLEDKETVDFVGFSIGAFVALKVSSLLGNKVKNIHLVSAAAPLNSGNYIDKMAGGFVFKLAQRHPIIFLLLTQYQRLLSYLSPKFLFKILFSSATGADLALSKEVSFQKYIIPILQSCFSTNSRGYMRDVTSYVQWNDDLKWCHAKTTNWHGTSDNWSPFDMAVKLQDAIPGAVKLEALKGLSHYSCLFEAAPKIIAQLSSEQAE